MQPKALIEVRNLQKHYPIASGFLNSGTLKVRAVDGINFSIEPGTTLGLVGESGCGKSTVGKVLLGLSEKTGGEIFFEGQDWTAAKGAERKRLARKMQMVFQDPYSSLDPRMKVYDLISEGMMNYGLAENLDEMQRKVGELMQRCGLFPQQAGRYAHQFSGGQRQRICIARALATEPDFIVLDEAVSALDVSIQAQIINLLKDLQEQLHLTYLFISHDLNIVRFISDYVAVMYLGEIVEYGSREQIFRSPKHPYTQALLSASPAFTREEKKNKARVLLQGDLPSPYDLPRGCRFAGRCPLADDHCREVKPELQTESDGHQVMCHKSGQTIRGATES